MSLVKSAKNWTQAQEDAFFRRMEKRVAWLENYMAERHYPTYQKRLIRAFYKMGATPDLTPFLVECALKDFFKLEHKADLAVRRGWTPENI